jgi:hypothetical protein
MATRTASAGYAGDFARTLTHAERLARLDRLARLMDTAFAIPGTKIRLGADAVLGLAPGVGDIIAQAVSAYILYEAHRMGVPKLKLMRMGGNILMDMTFGVVPIAGDVFDVFWRSNLRNMKIVRDHVEKQGRR